jgi:hypothetical protein
MIRIIGLVLLAVSATLLVLSYNASQSVTETIVEGLTGHFTDQTTVYFIGGTAAFVSGAALSVWGGRRAAA